MCSNFSTRVIFKNIVLKLPHFINIYWSVIPSLGFTDATSFRTIQYDIKLQTQNLNRDIYSR